jgi:hypothetical protein
MTCDGEERTTPALFLTYPMYGHSFGVCWGWLPPIYPGGAGNQVGKCPAVEAMAGLPAVGATYSKRT